MVGEQTPTVFSKGPVGTVSHTERSSIMTCLAILVTELAVSLPVGLKVVAASQSITFMLRTGNKEEADDALTHACSLINSSLDTLSASGNVPYTN